MKPHELAIPRVAVILMLLLSGCSEEAPLAPEDPDALLGHTVVSETESRNPGPPSELVDVTAAGENLSFWPYTGSDFGDTRKDPISLVFVGEADPVAIRAALMSLDGDRTAFGFPPTFPFNATWSEAIGNVQSCYADGDGWVGSAIQLEAGSYDQIRFHLRLFRTGEEHGDGEWTLGAAHFEITIPGTAEHQVICWELAEQIVVADLMRSGLLDPNDPPSPTGVINEAPFYRDIPAVLFNGLPEDLKAACGLPAGDASKPVPIPNDGQGTILHLAEAVEIEETEHVQDFVVNVGQIVPMPFCSDGPLDYILIEGPLALEKVARVSSSGRYRYESSIRGELIVTPMDVTQNPPVPAGESFLAKILDKQSGRTDAKKSKAKFQVQRIALQAEGTERLDEYLKIDSEGSKKYRLKTRCLTPESGEDEDRDTDDE